MEVHDNLKIQGNNLLLHFLPSNDSNNKNVEGATSLKEGSQL